MGKYKIGLTGSDLKDDAFILQPDDHSCALYCQQIIMRDYGVFIPFEDLERIATEDGIYSKDGTRIFDLGKALRYADIPYHVSEGNTVNDLLRECAQGHRVMVCLDANELWYNNTHAEKMANKASDVLTEFLKKAFHINGGNHALLVAGFEVDTENPKNLKIVLVDTGDGHARITYPADQFADAWHDSNCLMVATDNPAPYQYDAERQMMVPSEFAVEEHVNKWVEENSFQLKPEMIFKSEGHVPYYSSSKHCAEMYEMLGLDDLEAGCSDDATIDINSIGYATVDEIFDCDDLSLAEDGEVFDDEADIDIE